MNPDVLTDLSRYTGTNPSTIRPVSCPVDPLRRFVGPSVRPPARDTAEVCRLLEWAYGHRAPVVEGQRRTRRAPSAGAMYPIEVLVVTRRDVSYYDFTHHQLHGVPGVDAAQVAGRLGLESGQHGVVLAGVVWRTVQRYGTRGYRYCLLDAAHIAANLAAAATATGYQVAPVFCQGDPGLDDLLGLRHGELSLLALTVMPDAQVSSVPDPLHRAPMARWPAQTSEQPPILSPALQRVVWLHRRSASSTLDTARPWLPDVPPRDVLFELMNRRQSARDFTGGDVPSADLAALATTGTDAMHTGFTVDTPSLKMAVLDSDLASVAEACQGQGIVARSAAAFVITADAAEISAYGYAGYGRAVVNAGLVTAALYRAATGRGVGTTTIGGFTDAEVARCVGDQAAHPIVIQVIGEADHTARKADAALTSSYRTS
ncbi:MAG TPA: nitroreductase family protein [Nitriliruptorales bacterium]|nr:nitroreductase family protein [Nitriliruptorales bacterium]